jgi:hypothetical protein
MRDGIVKINRRKDMTNKGSFLKTKEFLAVGDYLVSNSGYFNLIMQSDGNLCVYRGTDPSNNKGAVWCCANKSKSDGPFFATMQDDGNFCVYKGTDPSNNKGGVWCCANKSRSDGPFFAVMQDDGNFCVYKGTDPSNNKGVVWSTTKTDPVVKADDLRDFNYNTDNYVKTDPVIKDLDSVVNTNQSSINQTLEIDLIKSVTETYEWSHSLEIAIGVSTSFKVGIPIFADGEVNVSMDVSNTFTWSESNERSETWEYHNLVVAEPFKEITCTLQIREVKLTVPFTATATAHYKSGVTAPIQINGEYIGGNSYDSNVKYDEKDLKTQLTKTTLQTTEATPKNEASIKT